MPKAIAIRFRIDFSEASNIGPGKIDLLEAIDKLGSVAQAARSLEMSYRRAWLLIESLNTSFLSPVTINSAGGHDGGGAEVTPFGKLLFQRYRILEKEFAQLAAEYLSAILPKVRRDSKRVVTRTPLKKTRRAR